MASSVHFRHWYSGTQYGVQVKKKPHPEIPVDELLDCTDWWFQGRWMLIWKPSENSFIWLLSILKPNKQFNLPLQHDRCFQHIIDARHDGHFNADWNNSSLLTNLLSMAQKIPHNAKHFDNRVENIFISKTFARIPKNQNKLYGCQTQRKIYNQKVKTSAHFGTFRHTGHKMNRA